jgi:enamine deaminase RidA (YjgF/YER057c/UK114 family)
VTQIKRVGSGGPWEQLYGYARAVAAGPWILTSGCTSTVDGAVKHAGDPAEQAKEAFRIALDALVDAGGSIRDVVRTRMYVTDPSYADPVGRAHGELFGLVRPAATLVVVARLLHPDQLVEVEIEAYHDPAAGHNP